MKASFALAFVFAMTETLAAASGPPADVAARAKGAAHIVVATVTDVHSHFDVNQWGDQLIVSEADVEVEETLKGAQGSAMSVTIEGGTVGDITLDVSDMPKLKKDDRAVFFLNDKPNGGGHIPSGRGYGVLKLDSSNHVEDSDVSLDDVKRIVKDAR